MKESISTYVKGFPGALFIVVLILIFVSIATLAGAAPDPIETEFEPLSFESSVFGLVHRPPGLEDPMPSGRPGILSPPPSSWDWRDQNRVSPIKDQGSFGSCWNFTVMGELESQVLIHESITYDFSEYNLLACNPFNTTCVSGGNDFYAAAYLTLTGTVGDACDPYSQCPTVTCNSGCTTIITPLEWHYLANDVAELKDAVYNIGPAYTSVNASAPGFITMGPGDVLYYTTVEPTNHAVLLIGWDDTKPHAGGSGAWLIKNAWGTDWGDNGYGWVAYGSAGIGTESSVYVMYQAYDPDEEVYFYDDNGSRGGVTYGMTTTWGMVRYNPQNSGFLKRVDFWTWDINYGYMIRLYDDFDGSSTSTLLASKDGDMVRRGYYSVELDSPVRVTAGDEIFVAVGFSDTVNNGYAPTDLDGPAETGKCYISWNGTDWSPYNSRDVAIRARIIKDADYDMIPDSIEASGCMLPNNPDTDGDGLCDGHLAVGLTCESGEDMDGDGVVDPGETDPCNADTDGDGLTDGDEVTIYLTDGTLWDTDGDLIPDLYEVFHADSATYDPPLNPFDPTDGDTSFELIDDTNPNFHEYWNNSDPWATDPVPGQFDPDKGCYYWGDADGDGVVQANDKTVLGNAIVGLAASYDNVIPGNGGSQDLDADDILQAGDMNVLQNYIAGNATGLILSRAVSLEKVYETASAVAVGSTTHVTVRVRNNASSGNLYQSSFSVVFSVDPASVGAAVLLGGEGEDSGSAPGNRYDVSSQSGAIDGGHANIALKVTAPGDIIINARIPACGTSGVGRWCDEVVLSPAFTVTGQ